MNPFNYRELNFNCPEEVSWAAKNYCSNPGYWEPTWVVADSSVEQQVARINGVKNDPAHRLLVAELETGVNLGFHWLRMELVPPGTQRYVGFRMNDAETRYAQIVHLWVHDDYHGRGIATHLKQMGEEWARLNGATRIQTSVHARNKRMFELNTRFGFEAGNILMSKNL